MERGDAIGEGSLPVINRLKIVLTVRSPLTLPSPPGWAHHCTHLTQGVEDVMLGACMLAVNISPKPFAIESRRQ